MNETLAEIIDSSAGSARRRLGELGERGIHYTTISLEKWKKAGDRYEKPSWKNHYPDGWERFTSLAWLNNPYHLMFELYVNTTEHQTVYTYVLEATYDQLTALLEEGHIKKI